MSIRDYIDIVEGLKRSRFSWTTKLRLARTFATEADANAYIINILKRRECSPFDTREGWIIYDGLGKRMLSDNSIIETVIGHNGGPPLSSFKRREPMPMRSGTTPDAYRQHILDVMQWKMRRHGSYEFSGTVGESLSVSGLKAAESMEQEGIVQLLIASGVKAISREQHPVSKYSAGLRFVITPGPKFPKPSPTGNSA